MKWIDDQDDYFLRDFNNGGDKGESQEFSFPASSSNTTPVADDCAEAEKEQRRKRHRRHRRFAWFFIIVFAVLAVAFYIRYFVPYTSDTLTTGYITLVEKRGIFFKTYEGEMLSESVMADTSKVYSRDFYFSIPDDSLGRVVQSYQGTGQRVVVTTEKYFGTVPWRGSQKTVITSIEPVE